MSRFHLVCLLVLLTSASISVNKTAALNVLLEAQEPQSYLRQDLPDIFLFIFRDTYTILSNTVVGGKENHIGCWICPEGGKDLRGYGQLVRDGQRAHKDNRVVALVGVTVTKGVETAEDSSEK